MDISERIKLVRGKLSQDEFSKKIGVHKNSLGRYERGDSTPNVDLLEKLYTTLGVCPQWFALGIGPMYTDGTSKAEGHVDSTQISRPEQPAVVGLGELEKRISELEKQVAVQEGRLEEKQATIEFLKSFINERLQEPHKGGAAGKNVEPTAPGAHFSGRSSSL